MKKFLSIVIVCILLIMGIIALLGGSLSGCAKCISTETSTVQVKIVDEYYRAPYTLSNYNPGTKSIDIHTYPAKHRMTVEYDGTEYYIYGSEAYHKYSDKIGEYANGILETKKYDDGTERYDIIDLE